jgi:hypothetical protein
VLLAALLTSALAGCVHTSTIPLADLSESLDKDIVVTTHDGKTARYNAGSFEVIMSDSGGVLRTKGSVGDGQAGHPMGRQGSSLAFANIAAIETRENVYSDKSDQVFRSYPTAYRSAATMVLLS